MRRDVILAGPPWQAWSAPSWEEIEAAEAKEKTKIKQPQAARAVDCGGEAQRRHRFCNALDIPLVPESAVASDLPAQSKIWRTSQRPCHSRSVLDCGDGVREVTAFVLKMEDRLTQATPCTPSESGHSPSTPVAAVKKLTPARAALSSVLHRLFRPPK